LVFFDTLRDARLPRVDGLVIGGGFPEIFMRELEANAALRGEILAASKPACRIRRVRRAHVPRPFAQLARRHAPHGGRDRRRRGDARAAVGRVSSGSPRPMLTRGRVR